MVTGEVVVDKPAQGETVCKDLAHGCGEVICVAVRFHIVVVGD